MISPRFRAENSICLKPSPRLILPLSLLSCKCSMRLAEAVPNHTPGEAFSKAAMDIATQMVCKLLTFGSPKLNKQTCLFLGQVKVAPRINKKCMKFFSRDFKRPLKFPHFEDPLLPWWPWKTSKNVFEEIWSASVPEILLRFPNFSHSTSHECRTLKRDVFYKRKFQIIFQPSSFQTYMC